MHMITDIPRDDDDQCDEELRIQDEVILLHNIPEVASQQTATETQMNSMTGDGCQVGNVR